MVVNNDEWILSNTGFSASPSASTFINNITNLFTGDQSGNFLAYSNNFGLNQSSLNAAVTGAGHSWTVSTAASGPVTEANAWNQVLATAGLAFQTSYNGIGGNVAPVCPHPLLAGVSTLYFNNGNTVSTPTRLMLMVKFSLR